LIRGGELSRDLSISISRRRLSANFRRLRRGGRVLLEVNFNPGISPFKEADNIETCNQAAQKERGWLIAKSHRILMLVVTRSPSIWGAAGLG